ncbi:MAG: hypothetical protein AABW72_02580 [archaeon]
MKINSKILIFIVLILVIAGSYFLFFNSAKSQYAYTWQNNTIKFNSNIYQSLNDSGYMSKKTFLISPAMTSFSSQQNTNYTNDFLIPFLVVLSGNDKNAVTFIRVYDANSDLAYCSTNFGNVKDEKKLPKEQCLNILSDSALIKIQLENLDGLKPQSEVLLSEDSIIIIPKDISDLKKIFIIISQDLFPNYKNIITNSNILSSYVMK